MKSMKQWGVLGGMVLVTIAGVFLGTTVSHTQSTGRITDGLVVLYGFWEGAGTTVADVSGVGTPLNLTIHDPNAVTWLSGGGLSIDASTLIATPGPGTKIIDAVKSTGELTLEAWVKPANTTQSGPARIVTLSQNTSNRNVTLGQGVTTGDQWDVRFRTTSTDGNGTPSLTTAAGTLTTELTHVVYTRAATGETKIYLDGVLTAQGTAAGTVDNWKNFFQLAFGNELTGGRPW